MGVIAMEGRMVECSHLLDPDTFTFIGCFVDTPYADTRFSGRVLFDTREETKSGATKRAYSLVCDLGTHIDSPAHWFKNGKDISQITLEELRAPGVVIDVKEKVQENADYLLTKDDVLQWEQTHGKIPEKALVCMRTGWSKRFSDHRAYLGVDEENRTHFPGFGLDAAEYLLSCGIVGIGIDTGSTDFGLAIDYPVHNAVLGAGKYQVENMNLEELPEANFQFLCVPIRIKDAPEA